MNAKLNLGVQKWLDGDSLDASKSAYPTGVFARIVPESRSGTPIQTLVPIGAKGATSAIDVPAGRLNVQVRLPSGEILIEDVEVAGGQEATLVMHSRSSPHEWMSWPRFLSSMAVRDPRQERADPRVAQVNPQLWVRDEQGQIAYPPDRFWRQEDDSSLGLLSCTFDEHSFPGRPLGRAGERPYLAFDVPGPQLILATIPLPWNREQPEISVQVVLKLCHGETIEADAEVDVLVHDEWLAPMLGYLRSGDLAAARAFEPSVLKLAEDMLFEKVKSPIAAAAGAYLLLRTRSLDQLHDWPKNLAAWYPWLPDGAIVRATQLLRSPFGRRDLGEIRRCFLEAGRRGAPVFTEGVRLLGNGLRLLGSWEASEAGPQRRRRDDDEFEALMRWVETLESATRPDPLFTVLQADEASLPLLVQGLRP